MGDNGPDPARQQKRTYPRPKKRCHETRFSVPNTRRRRRYPEFWGSLSAGCRRWDVINCDRGFQRDISQGTAARRPGDQNRERAREKKKDQTKTPRPLCLSAPPRVSGFPVRDCAPGLPQLRCMRGKGFQLRLLLVGFLPPSPIVHRSRHCTREHPCARIHGCAIKFLILRRFLLGQFRLGWCWRDVD